MDTLFIFGLISFVGLSEAACPRGTKSIQSRNCKSRYSALMCRMDKAACFKNECCKKLQTCPTGWKLLSRGHCKTVNFSTKCEKLKGICIEGVCCRQKPKEKTCPKDTTGIKNNDCSNRLMKIKCSMMKGECHGKLCCKSNDMCPEGWSTSFIPCTNSLFKSSCTKTKGVCFGKDCCRVASKKLPCPQGTYNVKNNNCKSKLMTLKCKYLSKGTCHSQTCCSKKDTSAKSG